MDAIKIIQEDVSEFAFRLEAMTGDEVFTAMRSLENHSEDDAGICKKPFLELLWLKMK